MDYKENEFHKLYTEAVEFVTTNILNEEHQDKIIKYFEQFRNIGFNTGYDQAERGY
jgi:hypothetical protein